MVTHAQIDFYRTFGFVVLPGLIGPDDMAALSAELDCVLPEAFGDRWRSGRTTGSRVTICWPFFEALR